MKFHFSFVRLQKVKDQCHAMPVETQESSPALRNAASFGESHLAPWIRVKMYMPLTPALWESVLRKPNSQ